MDKNVSTTFLIFKVKTAAIVLFRYKRFLSINLPDLNIIELLQRYLMMKHLIEVLLYFNFYKDEQRTSDFQNVIRSKVFGSMRKGLTV